MRNGTSVVKIKTIHGVVEFGVQRWRIGASGEEVTYFDLSGEMGEGYVSERLKELSVYYGGRMSYENVAELVERVSGVGQLSDRKIHGLVIEAAMKASGRMEEASRKVEGEGMPEVKGEVDVYAEETKEVVIYDDANGVREQKAHRETWTPPKGRQADWKRTRREGSRSSRGHRQKKKGLSWSQIGSHALGLLKVVELNGQWNQLWTPQGVAA